MKDNLCNRYLLQVGGSLMVGACLVMLVSNHSCAEAKAADDTVTLIRAIDAMDSKPLAGCVVTNGDYAALSEGIVGKTNAAGECALVARPLTFKMPRDGTSVDIFHRDFWIQFPGYVSQHISAASSMGCRTGSDTVTVRMVRGRRISGRVARLDNSPVVNEPALLVGNTNEWPVQHEVLTDNKGAFAWDGAPQGKVYIVMGVDKLASDAIFEMLDVNNVAAVVRVPAGWQGVGKDTGAKLVYLRQSAAGPVQPALLRMEGRDFCLANALESPPRPETIDHVVLSYAGRQAPVDFFGVGGKKDCRRVRGEMSSGGVADQCGGAPSQKDAIPKREH
jgi:hypothetical protein